MKDYRKAWFDSLLQREPRSLMIRSRFTVTGEVDKHLGPMWQFARATLDVEPAERFEVIDVVPEEDEARRFGHPEAVIFGLLDVLMVADLFVGKARIVLKETRIHPVDSSFMALRKAGQDAGRKILDVVRGGSA